MVPALQARRVDLQGSLKGEGGHGGSAGGERTRLRSILVVAECALAVMLVIGATLLIKSFWRIQHVDAGFESAGILKAEYQLPVEPVSGGLPPLSGPQGDSRLHPRAAAEGRAASRRRSGGRLRLSSARSGLHEFVSHHRPRSGGAHAARNLDSPRDAWLLPHDGRSPRARASADRRGPPRRAPPVLLINEAAAQRFFAGQEPLGKQINFWGATPHDRRHHRQRAVPGTGGGAADRRLRAARSGAVRQRRRRAPRADVRRSHGRSSRACAA